MNLVDFIAESNRIEGITRTPTGKEFDEAERFLKLERVMIEDMVKFVKVYQPNARLRDKIGLNVRVGSYFPPLGHPGMRAQLNSILGAINAHIDREAFAFRAHHLYESLHPFTDGNGRSGRMLWLWMMRGNAPLGFLHTWYYQSLHYGRG